MEFRHLGKSGLKVSEIAYGNWLTHGGQIEADIASECVREALDLGITTFDTADVYAGTKAESILGEILSQTRRDSIEICTKVYWPTGPSVNDRGLSRKHIIRSCEGSLKRLKTDYIDLYQAHRYDFETPIEEVAMAFDDLVKSGKVLYLGVSEWTADQISSYMNVSSQLGLNYIVSNQPQYSILWRVIEERVVPECQKYGIGQIVWSPLAQGVLTGKYLPGEPFPNESRASDPAAGNFIAGFLRDEILEAVVKLGKLAAELGMTCAQLALSWVLNQNGVSSAIVGATRPAQLRENVKAVGVKLDADVLKQIDQITGNVVIKDPELTKSPPVRP